MGTFKNVFLLSTTVFVVFVGVKVHNLLLGVPPLPKLQETWWGPGKLTKEDTSVKEFKINISNELFLGSFYPSLIIDEEHKHLVYPLSNMYSTLLLELGYLNLQATKPDTFGVALNDSPIGLAAYILEKITTGTYKQWKNLPDGGLTKKFTYTQLLDNVMIYWVTKSATTSSRLYAETFNKTQIAFDLEKIPVMVPSACAKFTNEIGHQPDFILKDAFPNLLHSSMNEGGHFASMEVPEILAKDIFTAIEKIDSFNTAN